LVSRGNLYKILGNHIYAGRIDHKGQIHEGLHEGIINLETWQAVQEKLKAGSVLQSSSSNTKRGNNSLRKKLFDPDGVIYTPTYTKKGSRQYRYYISQNLLQYKDQPKGQIARIPAEEIEKKISGIIKDRLTMPESFINLYPDIDQNAAAHLVNYFNKTNDNELLCFIQKIVISSDNLNITFDTGHIEKVILEALSITLPETDPEQAIFSVPYNTGRGENGMIVIQPEGKPKSRLDLPANTLKKLVQGVIWREKYFDGMTLEQLAKTNNCSWTHVSNCIDLSFHF
jgi:site-specific DNA recombinase